MTPPTVYALVRRASAAVRSALPSGVSFATATCAHRKPAMKTAGSLDRYSASSVSARASRA
eukprot:scaffold52843_cov73-Phaeocystis_antarctica.AAC.3